MDQFKRNMYLNGPNKWLIRAKVPTLAEQSHSLLEAYPQFSVVHSNLNEIIWQGSLQPTELSLCYTVKILYRRNDKQKLKVWVISPALKAREGESKIPHMYEQDRLCLYYPQAREWTPRKWIHKTIVPWICEWLYYYEIWHVTGEWLGGGIHGEADPESEDKEDV